MPHGPTRRTVSRVGNTEWWGMKYLDGPSVGKIERRTVVRGQTHSAVGLDPIEVFPDGRVHFGNRIVGFL
jgi:hypothetical protein